MAHLRSAALSYPARFSLRALPRDLEELPGGGEALRRELVRPTGEKLIEERFAVLDESGARIGSAVVAYRPEDAPPPGESPYRPWVRTVARSLLEPRDEDEAEAYREMVSAGLNTLIPDLPMEALVIVDNERRIQYVNEPEYLETGFGSAPYLAHVGLGDATQIDRVEVVWPGSRMPRVYSVVIKELNTLDENDGGLQESKEVKSSTSSTG